MKQELEVKGAYEIKYKPLQDERGFFARLWDIRELFSMGLYADFIQCNLSFSNKKGTFRGFHYQVAPFGEEKLVTCIYGSANFYIVDLRHDSPTYKHLNKVELSVLNHNLVYMPKGCANAIHTLATNTRLVYWTTCKYHIEKECGVRWNDPLFNNSIPEPEVISGKDSSWDDYLVGK